MSRTPTLAVALAERLCRPQRVGVFGHRGVGKTTLLTVLYREAVSGRLPELRLAAADTRTANYLSDKVLQLEAGQPLPATLGETDLRFHLYHRSARLDLLFKDYQGEHVELGREEPIRDFLRDCDAVWLCLDAATVSADADRLRRQQEVEQLVEDYLATEPDRRLHRPMALLLTKADLLGPELGNLDALAVDRFGMTRHALQSHCPHAGLMAVSCLGRAGGVSPPVTPPVQGADAPRSPALVLNPWNLVEPLTWLAGTLQAQDEARLERLWSLAGGDLGLLERCTACFARRYPDAPAAAAFRKRLREVRFRRFRRRGLAGVASAACLVLGLWTYDAWGHHRVEAFQREHADQPAAALEQWRGYQTWHPTRNLLGASSEEVEEARLRELQRQARDKERDERLAELRRRAADPDADPEASWQQFQDFHADYPEVSVEGDLQTLRSAIKGRRDVQVARRAQQAHDDLVTAEGHALDLQALIDQADRFLRDYPGTPPETDVRRRRASYFARIDERGIEVARAYSAKNPLNFQTRREHYQRYLDRHPNGAAVQEAQDALKAIDAEWDRHDFRAVRDRFLTRPGDIGELTARCRTYLAIHPQGRFAAAASDLLRWGERVTAPGEYRVVLREGQFEKSVARWFSRGPDLSVELEVAGARYGPSNILVNRYDPDWNYEFPRRIKWKLGDPVVIRVYDHDWKKRQVAEFASDAGDPLAIRMLSGEAWSGANRLVFESDFTMPKLPRIE